MRIPEKKILGIVLLMAILLISTYVLAHEQPQADQTSGAKQELPVAAPNLGDIIPLAVKLSGRLAILENGIKGGLDISAVEKKCAAIETNLKGPAGQLQRLKDSNEFRFNKLAELKEAIEQENGLFEEISEPLGKAIHHLGAWREEWLAEKKRWNEWQSSLPEEGAFDQVKSTFAKANDTIDTALNLILRQLESMLTVQEKAGNIQAKIDVFTAELDGLILVGRRSLLLDKSPPMFSSQYFSQFSNKLWYAVQNGLDDISWPNSRFFDRLGWIVLLQGFLSFVVIIAVYRKREVLKSSKHWRFLAARPFSAGLFLGVMTTFFIYQYGGIPGTWNLAITTIGGISFVRISGGLIETSWKRHFIYGLMIVSILSRLMDVVSLPLPLFRIYIVLISLVGILLCLRWAGESGRHKDSILYPFSLRLVSFSFVFFIIAELWGKKGLALYLFESLTRSIAIALVFMLFMYMIRGGLEWLFRSSPLRRATALYWDTDAIIRRAAIFIDVVIWFLVLLPGIFVIWGVYDSLKGAMKGLLALGFNLGSQRISVGLVLASAGIIYSSFLVSWILQKLLMDEVLIRRRVESGVRHSVGRLVHYTIMFVGFLLAISMLGFEVTKLTIMLSALGVGIGFGLQSIVNNFVSGLILLFERPVRVGDSIEIGGKWAEIKKIGLRATTAQTVDEADLIIPNADMVTNQVTNWTLTNRRVRLAIPVGVAYGSDVPLVTETLMACANANPMVAKTPASQVLFLSFGESSLGFELRIWVLDADHRLKAISALHQDIDRRFREAKIEIAFPQRDLHVRSLGESVILRPSETEK
jgi:potassium efflux system protein